MPNLAKKLVDKGTIIKDLSGDWLNNFYRILIGLPKENDAFLSEIGNIKTNRDPLVY